MALKEFAAHGYSKGSQNRIIKEAGFSKPSLYYYLGGKADLFAAVVAEVLDRFYSIVKAHIRRTSPGEFWTSLEEALSEIIRLGLDKNYNRIFRDFHDPAIREEIGPYLGDVERVANNWVREVIRAGLETGAFDRVLPMDLLARLMLSEFESLQEWLSMRLVYIRDDSERESIAEATLEVIRSLLESGYAVEPSRVEILHQLEQRRLMAQA